MTEAQLELLRALPLFIDGSDGSMWPCREPAAHWDIIAACPAVANRRFVCVAHLLELFDIRELPKPSPVIPQEEKPCEPGAPALS
jgi:hypothetical protein